MKILFGINSKLAFFLALFLIQTSSAQTSFNPLRVQLEAIEHRILTEHLTLATLNRPDHCPIEGTTFRDIANKMAAISASLVDGKCYEKHAKTIGEINRASRKIVDETLDLAPNETGSFIEHDQGTQIRITNNQYQSMQSSNTLITGLFEVAKDKECIESLRKSGKLSSVAEVITRFGTLGLFYPSSIGTIGSGILLASAGSLYILDKLIQPAFQWKYQQDRKDFLALTCAFYNLRTELYRADFFSASSDDLHMRLKTAEEIEKDLSAFLSELEKQSKVWDNTYQAKLSAFLALQDVNEQKTTNQLKLFSFLNRSLSLLESHSARGSTVSDRFGIRNYFLSHSIEMTALLAEPKIAPEFRDRSLFEMKSLLALSTDELLAMSKSKWIGRMMALSDLFRQLIKNDLTEISSVLDEFGALEFEPGISNDTMNRAVHSEHDELYKHAQAILNRLETKVSNITRTLAHKTVSGNAQGSESEYDIYRELTVIKEVILGKKGWSFTSFLMSDAKKELKKFSSHFKKWKPHLKDAQSKSTICHDSAEIIRHWNHANTAIQLTREFLATNSDLWSQSEPYFKKYWGIPTGLNYTKTLYHSALASDLAKDYILKKDRTTQNAKAQLNEIHGLSYLMSINLGELMILLHDLERQKKDLDFFRDHHCAGQF